MNLTELGEQYFLGVIKGEYASANTTGFDRIGIYGSTGGGADAVIGSVQTITWGYTVGNASIYKLTPSTLIFVVPADTVVKGTVVFNSTIGTTYAYALAKEDLEVQRSFVNSGSVELNPVTYNFEHL